MTNREGPAVGNLYRCHICEAVHPEPHARFCSAAWLHPTPQPRTVTVRVAVAWSNEGGVSSHVVTADDRQARSALARAGYIHDFTIITAAVPLPAAPEVVEGTVEEAGE